VLTTDYETHLHKQPVKNQHPSMARHTDSAASIDDPLRASVPLPFHHVLYPYGFATHIKSNEPAIIRAAEQSWASFIPRFREKPIEVRFLVSDFPTRRRPPYPVFRAQGNLLTLVADSHNFGCCDLAAGFGFACVTKAAVMNRSYVRYHFLEAMVHVLLNALHVVALHAASLIRNGCGLLFVGDSGIGKSSFAYACARRGWTYVSDDASSLPRRRTGRLVIGNPHAFRFRPSVRSLFPELEGHVKVRNGKPTMELKTEQFPNLKLAPECTVDYVIFLNRLEDEPDAPHLVSVSREESLRRLFQNNTFPTELSIHEERLRAIERLLDAQLFQLNYRNFDPAIDLLEQVLRRDTS
jgi:hypothetical protein